MKKSLFALAILGAFASAASAQSSVTMYGVVDVGVSRDDNGAATTTGLNSGIQSGSRLGFRGVEDLGGGLKGLFVLETGINVDTGGFGQSNKAFGRQSYVGLQGAFGAVKLGRQNTLLRENLDALDPFRIGLAGDATRFFNQGGVVDATNATATTNGGGRMNNAIKYETPNLSGFTGQFEYGFGEQAGSTTAARQISGALQYANGPAMIALVHNVSDIATLGVSTDKVKTTLLGGTYDFNVVKAHVAFDTVKNDVALNRTNRRDYMVGATVPFGASTFLVDYTKRKDKTGANLDADQVAVGYTYALSKRTNLYTSYARTSNDSGSSVNLGTTSAVAGNTDNLFNVGVRHSF
ncbi:porin [Actimicrobium antarcticum]|uniref:Porin n=1 Tax=Actimicrobium antarcticum TaxID=1051899 RepID=A0ABP7SUP8_9BURK